MESTEKSESGQKANWVNAGGVQNIVTNIHENDAECEAEELEFLEQDRNNSQGYIIESVQ